MRLDVAVEIIRHEIIVAVIDDGVAQRGEPSGVTELAVFDGIEDFGKVRIQRERAVVVGVPEIFDVFGEVAE